MASSKVPKMAELLVRDQDLGKQPSPTVPLTIQSERISIREIIRSLVYETVQDRNLQRANNRSQHRPSILELELNGPKRVKAISWQHQFDLAIDAFERGRFLVLVDDRQVESLDDEVEVIHSQTVVTFLRLVPLVGG